MLRERRPAPALTLLLLLTILKGARKLLAASRQHQLVAPAWQRGGGARFIHHVATCFRPCKHVMALRCAAIGMHAVLPTSTYLSRFPAGVRTTMSLKLPF